MAARAAAEAKGWLNVRMVMRTPSTANPIATAPVSDQSFSSVGQKVAKSATIVAWREPIMEGPPKAAIKGLEELPDFWWELAEAEQVGYNNRTRARIAGVPVEVMLDRGATRNSVTEELIVGMINHCHARGMTARSKDWPLVKLEHWDKEELMTGISGGLLYAPLGQRSYALRWRSWGRGRGP